MTLPGLLGTRVFVIDTSAVIEVRRLYSRGTKQQRKNALDVLSRLCRNATLSFPHQVYGELARGHDNLQATDDAPFDWVLENKFAAVSDTELFEHVRAVLDVVPDLVDRHKVSGADDADPYVVALAHKLLTEQLQVTVVSDDRKDQPDKTSIQSACGLLGIPAISMRAFLGHLKVAIPR